MSHPKLKVPVQDPTPPEGVEEGEEGNENTGAPVIENKAPETDAEKEALKAKVAELEREREEREAAARRQTQTQRPTITAAELESIPEEQREAVEKSTGLPFAEVVRKVRLQELAADREERMGVSAELNVRVAIDEAVESNPQNAKLKKHIREYLVDLPLDVRSDKTRLAREMKKAEAYARGVAGVPSTTQRRERLENANDKPDGGDNGDALPIEKGGDIKPGVYQAGELKIRIEDMPKDLAKKAKHSDPNRPHAVQFRADFDEEPRMR